MTTGPSDDDARAKLRSEGRLLRRSIGDAARTRADQAICGHLGSLAIPAGATVGVSITDDGEPDLAGFVEQLWATGRRAALPVPAPDADDFTMVFQPWEDGDELVPGRFAIPCPPVRNEVEPDVVLVPLVRFDGAGNRMGRGAGFYDRWLAGRSTIAIGVAFEVQRSQRLPVQPHDVAMAAIVTDLGIRLRRPTGEG